MSGSHAGRGILAMIGAVAAFSMMDAVMKHLVLTYPPMQVSCFRGLASIPFFVMGLVISREWRNNAPVQWRMHLIRGLLAIVMLSMFVYAVSELPLGSAYGIFLCAPLLITALSALILREHVGWHRWAAVVVGLMGVGVILDPRGSDMMTLGGLAALCSAICYALAALMIRRLARTESTLRIGLSFLLIISIGCGIAAYPRWVPLLNEHWPWIAALGGTGAAGQYLIIRAFRSASASVIAPFEYTALLWGISLDWIFWSTAPSFRIIIGGAIVISSGLYIIYREHRANRDALAH